MAKDPSTMMNDTQVLKALNSLSPLAKARQELHAACQRLETARNQHPPLLAIDLRRMEFEAVRRVAEVLGVIILPDGSTSHMVPWHG